MILKFKYQAGFWDRIKFLFGKPLNINIDNSFPRTPKIKLFFNEQETEIKTVKIKYEEKHASPKSS